MVHEYLSTRFSTYTGHGCNKLGAHTRFSTLTGHGCNMLDAPAQVECVHAVEGDLDGAKILTHTI